jgi:hypothetical protein
MEKIMPRDINGKPHHDYRNEDGKTVDVEKNKISMREEAAKHNVDGDSNFSKRSIEKFDQAMKKAQIDELKNLSGLDNGLKPRKEHGSGPSR